MNKNFMIFRIVFSYTLFAGVYIIYSDILLESMVTDIGRLTYLQTLKGWAFVLMSGALIYFLLNRELKNFIKIKNELYESEYRFRASFENSTTGMCLISQNGKFIKVNRAMYKMLDYTEWQILNLNLDLLIHPEDQIEVSDNFLKLANRNLESFTIECRFVKSNGENIWLIANISNIIDINADKLLYMFGHFQDISNLKNLVEQLEISKSYLESLIESRTIELTAISRDLKKEKLNRQNIEEKLKFSEKNKFKYGTKETDYKSKNISSSEKGESSINIYEAID